MAFVEPVQGDTILASHVTQITKLLRGAAGAGQDVALVQRTNASDYANTFGNVDTTNGYAAKFQYGPASAPTTIATFAKAGVTFSVPVALSGGLSIIDAAGDLIYGSANDTPARLAIGTARQVLAVNPGATAPQWVASLQSLMTAQGDMVYASAANTPAQLVKGTAFQELTMNAGATAPQWSSGALALAAAAGDTFYATAANTLARLAKGTAFQSLTMNSGATAPQWTSGPNALVTTAGDMTYATAANTLARLAAGTSSQVLHGGTTPSWSTVGTNDVAANAITQSGVTTTGVADSTTSSSFVDMSGLSVTLTTVGGDVLVFAAGAYTHSGASQNVQVGFQVDSVATVSGPAVHSNTTVGASVLWANTHIFTGLSATVHNFKSRWLTSAGTVTGYGGRTMVAIELKR